MTAESDGGTCDAGEAGRERESNTPTLEWLGRSERHRALASAERRLTLAALAGRGAPVELDGLASAVAELARGGGAAVDDEPVETDPEKLAIALHHVHLPVLEELGVLAYDPDGRTVVSCPVGSA